MSAVLAWFRLDVRLRWKSLVVMALLVAFAAATVMTAVSGARRGASAVDRLLAQTLPADVIVVPNQPGFDWDAVAALPEVETLSRFPLGSFLITELADRGVANFGGFAFADDTAMRTIERPVVLEGRLFDSSRPDEAVVSPDFARLSGFGVGDVVHIGLFTPQTQDELSQGGSLPATNDGPTVATRIVGVVRSPFFADSPSQPGGFAPSPGLYAKYPENIAGSGMYIPINAMARLRGGADAIPAFKEGLSRVSNREDIDVWDQSEAAQHYEDTTGFEANSLLVFALAAAVAAVFLVGQSVARYSAATVADLQVLRSLGLTAAQARRAAVLGPALAATIGVVFGAAASVLASRWFPIGTAEYIEPAPGIAVDPLVLVTAVALVPLLVACAAALSATLSLRRAAPELVERHSRIATTLARLGAPAPVVVGSRFALESGRGRRSIPVRPALLGAVVGVLGVLAAFTFANGVEDATANPARFGQSFELVAYAGYEGQDFVPVDEVLPVVAADADVLAVNDTRTAVGDVEGRTTTVFAIDPVDRPLDVVLTEGRAPERLDEIALGPVTAQAMGVQVGDSLTMNGRGATRYLLVSGLALLPEAPHNDYSNGAWVTESTYTEMFGTYAKFHLVLVSLRDGADPGAVAARIQGQTASVPGGEQFALSPPPEPSAMAEIRQVRQLPLFLAGFLALLAVAAVGHALATAVRRRRHDLAVLRALGMTRWQCRGVVTTQATVLSLVGLAIGVPLGLALGRTLWRYVADTTPVYYLPPVALWAIVLIAPVAIVIANVLAAWPGQRAASMRVASVLRAE